MRAPNAQRILRFLGEMKSGKTHGTLSWVSRCNQILKSFTFFRARPARAPITSILLAWPQRNHRPSLACTQLRTHARTHATATETEIDFPVGLTPPTSNLKTFLTLSLQRPLRTNHERSLGNTSNQCMKHLIRCLLNHPLHRLLTHL